MVHSAMVPSIASPMATRTRAAVDPRTAIRVHVRQLHILTMILIHMILFRQRRPKKRKWPNGLEAGATLWKGSIRGKEGAWILLPLAWIFLPQGLDFPSPRLGFSFP